MCVIELDDDGASREAGAGGGSEGQLIHHHRSIPTSKRPMELGLVLDELAG